MRWNDVASGSGGSDVDALIGDLSGNGNRAAMWVKREANREGREKKKKRSGKRKKNRGRR